MKILLLASTAPTNKWLSLRTMVLPTTSLHNTTFSGALPFPKPSFLTDWFAKGFILWTKKNGVYSQFENHWRTKARPSGPVETLSINYMLAHCPEHIGHLMVQFSSLKHPTFFSFKSALLNWVNIYQLLVVGPLPLSTAYLSVCSLTESSSKQRPSLRV